MKQMDRTHIYSGMDPTTVFIHASRPTTFRTTGTSPIHALVDTALTMMHHAPSPPAARAADFGRQPLNWALPSAMQLTKVRFFLSIQ